MNSQQIATVTVKFRSMIWKIYHYESKFIKKWWTTKMIYSWFELCNYPISNCQNTVSNKNDHHHCTCTWSFHFTFPCIASHFEPSCSIRYPNNVVYHWRRWRICTAVFLFLVNIDVFLSVHYPRYHLNM